MNEITIDLDDYLSTDTKEQIAENVFRDELSLAIHGDVERILNNAAYHLVFKMVDEAIDGDSKDKIKEKTLAAIDSMTEFSIFRKKDMWDREESKGYKYLQEAVENNKDLINKKVVSIIGDLNEYALKENLYEKIDEIIIGRIIGKQE